MQANALNALLFLMSFIFNFFQFCVLMRFLLQVVKADFRNPFCQFLIKMTSPILHPLRKIIPGFYGIDLAALVLFFLLNWAEVSLSSLIIYQYWSMFSMVHGLLQSMHFYLNLTFFIILIYALMSWIPQSRFHPMGILIALLAEPYLRLIRRVLPLIAGFDLSPLVAIVLIQVIHMLLPH
jgi:YggT family protein